MLVAAPRLVNRYDVEADKMQFAGKTVRSIPEHLDFEVLRIKALYKSTYLYL